MTYPTRSLDSPLDPRFARLDLAEAVLPEGLTEHARQDRDPPGESDACATGPGRHAAARERADHDDLLGRAAQGPIRDAARPSPAPPGRALTAKDQP